VNKMNIKQLITATAGALIICGNSAMAGTVGSMNSFTSGTAAVAADVNANFTEHTTQINDNATQLSSMQSLATSDHTATVDCSTLTIADVAGAQPAWGSLILIITGTCNENIVIDNRSNVTLKSTTGAIINGTDATIPTIDITGQQRIKLIGLTIRGGWNGVKAANNADVVLKNVTINDDASTVGPGLLISKNSTVTLVGNQDVTDGSGPSTGTNTITGGTDVDDGFGVMVKMSGMLHVYDGSTVINAGGNGIAAIFAGLAGGQVNDDRFIYSPTAAFTGNVILYSSLVNLDGFGDSSITGDVTIAERSTVTLNGNTTISGSIGVDMWSFFDNSGTGSVGTCTADSLSICQ